MKAIDIETELQEVEVKGFDMGDKTLSRYRFVPSVTY